MSAPFRYARKLLLIDPDTWQRLKQRAGPEGLPPDVSLKHDYQNFLQNKVAAENKTNKEWSQLAQKVKPIISAGVKDANNSIPDLEQIFANKTGKIDSEIAVNFAKSLQGIAGIKVNAGEDKIYLDGEPLAEKATNIIANLLRQGGRLTESMKILLALLSVRGTPYILDQIRNKEAINLLGKVQRQPELINDPFDPQEGTSAGTASPSQDVRSKRFDPEAADRTPLKTPKDKGRFQNKNKIPGRAQTPGPKTRSYGRNLFEDLKDSEVGFGDIGKQLGSGFRPKKPRLNNWRSLF